MRAAAILLLAALAAVAFSQSLDDILQSGSLASELWVVRSKTSAVYDPSAASPPPKKRDISQGPQSIDHLTGPTHRSPVGISSDRKFLVYATGNNVTSTKRGVQAPQASPNTVIVAKAVPDGEDGSINWNFFQCIQPNMQTSNAYGWALALSANATHDILVICDPWGKEATLNSVYTTGNSLEVETVGVCEYFSKLLGSDDDFELFETQSAQTFARGGSRAADPYYPNLFGFSVSLRGKYAAVGAPGTWNSVGTQVGAGYFFIRAGAGNFYQNEISLFRDTVESDMGYSISLSKTAEHGIVGIPSRTVNSLDNVGAVRVYQRVFDNGLNKEVFVAQGPEIATATASANTMDRMGSGVAINSVGVPTFHTGVVGFDYDGNTDTGATLRGFYATSGGWQTRISVLGSENFFVVLNSTTDFDNFGRNLAYITSANGSAPLGGDGQPAPRIIVTVPGQDIAVSYITSVISRGPHYRLLSSSQYASLRTSINEYGLFGGGLAAIVADDNAQVVVTTSETRVYVGYITCGSTNFWGASCAPCPENCAFGCDSGITGSGDCLAQPASNPAKYCDVNATHSYNGTKCQTECPLYCASCVTDNVCATCQAQRAGPFCNISCPAHCPTTENSCNVGPDGDGKCNLCDRNYWGPDCKACRVNGVGCSDGNCNDGGSGSLGYLAVPVGPVSKRWTGVIAGVTITTGLNDGTCRACYDTLYQYGSYCNNSCLSRPCAPLYDSNNVKIRESHCEVGVTGTGACLTCASNKFGANCTTCPATCKDDGTIGVDCNDGANGDGHCYICESGIWGPFCDKECSETCGYNSTVQAYCSDGPAPEATGLCLNCSLGYYGVYCENCDGSAGGTCNGPCDDGLDGTGACDGECYDNHWGSSCTPCPVNCSTNCNDLKAGNGHCVSCPAGVYGNGCTGICSEYCLTCSQGPDGDGHCLSCPLNFWDPECDTPCPENCQYPGPNQRTCDDDISGTGVCLDCPPTRFGSDCEGLCSPDCLTCDKGPEGTGACLTCPADQYSANCSGICLCTPGNCDDGVAGTGECTACPSGMAGLFCDIPCASGCLTCNETVTGNGLCLTCPPGKYGPRCDQTCSCLNDGACLSGPTGNGNCTACATGKFGPKCIGECNSACATCEDGPDGSGNCETCPANFFGQFCGSSTTCSSVAQCVSCGTTSEDKSCNPGPCPTGHHGPTCEDTWDTVRFESCASNTTDDGPYDCVCKTTGDVTRLFSPDCLSCDTQGCEFGPCDYGVTGDGSCTDCDADYHGPNCEPCTCEDGICDDGLNGDGQCSACNDDVTYGDNCDTTCALTGGCNTCSDGPSGDGSCTGCADNYYGSSCTACPTDCAQNCFDGMSGNGSCISCAAGSYGPDCTGTCSTSCATCNDGPNGDGSCLSCPANYYGADCVNSCPTACSSDCNDDVGGDGSCVSCSTNTTYGNACTETCSSDCATCDNGPSGTGACTSCLQGRYGADCTGECPESCAADCDAGLTGTGACNDCDAGAFGSNCSSYCPTGCPDSSNCNDGPAGNGTCTACVNAFRYGPTCAGVCGANCATCSNGLDGDGTCSSCIDNTFGAGCTGTCPAGCATDCNDGLAGTGVCNDCAANIYGANCTLNCSVGCATCSDGPTGTGACNTCRAGYFGASCTACSCTGGQVCADGITGAGTCSNAPVPAPAGTSPNTGGASPSGSGPIGNVPTPATGGPGPSTTSASSVVVSMLLVLVALALALN